MLTVDEALGAVLERARPLPPAPLPVEEALGLALAEDVAADIDLPPFDKSMVDGYAVRAADLAGDDRRLRIGETITAGQTPTSELGPRGATVIMTGAPVPPGCDAVVMHERTRLDASGAWVEIERDGHEVRSGQNILRRGREMRSGDVVAKAGTVLTPAWLGVLASVGRTSVLARRPRAAIVATGDELVRPDQTPGPGQIRNSNTTLLRALAIEAGAEVRSLPDAAPDRPEALRQALAWGLDFDLMLITGGVSAGQRDLVPDTLEELGVSPIFHKVRLKPGKPLWFGAGPERADGRPGALVFGLPGNPVSGFVGFLLFVRPALEILLGKPRANVGPRLVPAHLAAGFSHRGERPTYHPARAVQTPSGLEIEPLAWSGSADLRTVASADGLAVFPAGDRDHRPGETVEFLLLVTGY